MTSESPLDGATVVVAIVVVITSLLKMSSKKPIKSPIARIPRFSRKSEFQIEAEVVFVVVETCVVAATRFGILIHL